MSDDEFTKGFDLNNSAEENGEKTTSEEELSGETANVVAEKEEAPVKDGRPCLSENIFAALDHLEHNFIFRKMGIVFDYVSRPGDFPRSALPRSKDIKSGIPNAAGIGTGLGECIDNTCLLLDGYLTRLELGLSRLDEARIMDRLIAGLIRLGTISQQNRIVRGFSPDGRSYYQSYSALNCTWYAHGLLRAFETPTVAPESQAKLRDIGNKWLTALKNDNFEVPGIVNQKNSILPLDSYSEEKRWENNIRIIHLAAVLHHMTGNKAWLELYKKYTFEETGSLRIKADLPVSLTDNYKLLSLQTALADIAHLHSGQSELVTINLIRKKIAFRTAEVLRDFQPPELSGSLEDAVLDWKDGLPQGNAPLAELKERAEKHWPRIGVEMSKIAPASQAALCVMLSGDENLIKDNSKYIEKLITELDWGNLWSVTALSPLLLVHAVGHEYSLWDYPCEVSFENRAVGNSFGYEFTENDERYRIDDDAVSRYNLKRSSFYPAFIEEQEGNLKKGSPDKTSGKTRKKKTRRRRTRRRPMSGNEKVNRNNNRNRSKNS